MSLSFRDYKSMIVFCACVVFVVGVLATVGVFSDLGGRALDLALQPDTTGQAQTARVVTVGMFNRVTVDQAQTGPAQPAASAGGGFLGLTKTDWGILAVFVVILVNAIVVFFGAWKFFDLGGA